MLRRFLALVPCVIFLCASSKAQLGSNDTKRPSWVTNPTAAAAGNFHDTLPPSSAQPLDDPSHQSRSVTTVRPVLYGDLPTSASDLVIAGDIVSSVSKLNDSHQRIYTDLEVRIDKVVASKYGITPNKARITEHGGAVQLPSGRVLTQEPSFGDCPLEVGTKYLLFLTENPVANSYRVIRAYDLSAQRPTELDLGGLPVSQPTLHFDTVQELLAAAGSAAGGSR